jgi:hypothetical protein
VIDEKEIAAIQEELGRLALAATRIDLDGFLEASERIASPQALAAGIPASAVTSAGAWNELARLLKPFREEALSHLGELEAHEAELVPERWACPGCGERRMDELANNDDDTVTCATCGRRYTLPDLEPRS